MPIVTSEVLPLSTQPSVIETTQEPVTTVVGRAGTIELDLYIVYLIIGLISTLGIVVLILIISVICFYMINRRNHNYDLEKRTMKKDSNTQSTAELLSSESINAPKPGANRFSQDSAIYTDSCCRSVSPSRSNSPGSEDGKIEAMATRQTKNNSHLQNVADESSPRHSMAGSKDNLLQSSSV